MESRLATEQVASRPKGSFIKSVRSMNIDWDKVEELAILIAIFIFNNLVSFMVNTIVASRLYTAGKDF